MDNRTLNSIDWSGLTHVYGPASDVPELFEALLGEDDDAITEAQHVSLYRTHRNPT